MTAPYKTLKEWGEKAMPMPSKDYMYHSHDLKPIYYKELDLNKKWQDFNIEHELTTKGIEKFSQDWNNLVA